MFDNLTLLAMAKKKMDWIAERQNVLSQNVANADTPKYQPKDLKPLSFKDQLQGTAQVAMVATNPMHLQPQTGASAKFEAMRIGKPSETTPDGNSISLEEQAYQMSQGKDAYDFAANLVDKQMKMLQTSISSK